MKDNIYKLVADILKVDISLLHEIEDSPEAWDSLSRVEVIFAIEDEYGITFEDEELSVALTPKSLINLSVEKGELR